MDLIERVSAGSRRWLTLHRAELTTLMFGMAMLGLFQFGFPASAICMMTVWALSVADELDALRARQETANER